MTATMAGGTGQDNAVSRLISPVPIDLVSCFPDRQKDTNPKVSFPVLPSYTDERIQSAIPAPAVTEVALRIRHLIEECVPCELKENHITSPHSRILTAKVIQAAKEAGGREYKDCVVFCLLIN
jgi:hypothetical protein